MNRWIAMLWATTVLPFATLPWISIARSQPQPWCFSHALFHIVYLPIIVVAIVAARQLASSAPPRGVWTLALLVVVAETVAFAGHLGELIAVAQHGGLDAGEDIFSEMLHEVPAAFTVPGVLAGVVLVVVITIVAAADAYRGRRKQDSSFG